MQLLSWFHMPYSSYCFKQVCHWHSQSSIFVQKTQEVQGLLSNLLFVCLFFSAGQDDSIWIFLFHSHWVLPSNLGGGGTPLEIIYSQTGFTEISSSQWQHSGDMLATLITNEHQLFSVSVVPCSATITPNSCHCCLLMTLLKNVYNWQIRLPEYTNSPPSFPLISFPITQACPSFIQFLLLSKITKKNNFCVHHDWLSPSLCSVFRSFIGCLSSAQHKEGNHPSSETWHGSSCPKGDLIQPSVSSSKSPSQREADSSSWERQPKDKVSALSRLEDTGKPVHNFVEAHIVVHPLGLVKHTPTLCSLLGLQ